MLTDDGTIAMMPGLVLAWILVGFTALLLVAGLISWLSSERRARRDELNVFERMGRDQLTREVLEGEQEGTLAARSLQGAEAKAQSDESIGDLKQKRVEERERAQLREEQRFKRAS